jgi:sugar-specific transcriptional regulator TrmB
MFTQLGLTSIQAEVYLTLAKLGQSKVKTIAKNLQIDRAQVYRALPTLEENGLVQKILTKPINYRAIPLEQAFPILINRQTKTLDNIQEKVEDFIKKFGKTKQELSTKEQPKYVISSMSTAHQNKVKQLFNNLKNSLDVMFNWEVLRYTIKFYGEEYERALRRGVKVRFITDKAKDSEIQKIIQPLKEIGSVEVRKATLFRLSPIAIFDNKIVDIITSTDNIEVLRVSHQNLVSSMHDYFELKWRSAHKQ